MPTSGITLSNFVKNGSNFTAQTSQDGNLLVNPLAVTLAAMPHISRPLPSRIADGLRVAMISCYCT